MTPKYQSRYPLLLPKPEDMTPRWQRISDMVDAHPETFAVKEVNGFRMVTRIPNPKLDEQVKSMLTKMGVNPGGIREILDIDPIATISPTLRSMWSGRGQEVAEHGLITLQYFGTDKVYQYPFIVV